MPTAWPWCSRARAISNTELKVNLLVLDIGNSRVKGAVFTDDELRTRTCWQGHPWRKILDWAYNQQPRWIILSSVVETPPSFVAGLEAMGGFVTFTHATPLPLRNAYHTPHTLGKDRLAAAMGARHLFPDTACVIFDAGTCLTSDLLTAEGTFLGGNISPGLHMRLQAMHAFTAHLPQLAAQAPRLWYGRNTHEAMHAGAFHGMLWEMESFATQAKNMLGSVQVVITGGDAPLFARYWKTEIFANPDLVLIGLNQILKYHVENTA